MNILIFNTVCLYNNDKTIIYGQYSDDINYSRISINIDINIKYNIIFYNERRDFFIEIYDKITYINKITFEYNNTKIIDKNEIFLLFPFEKCNLHLNSDSAIISTMCKNYSFRLDEWIEYNIKLGFSGIIIFDNDGNNSNNINESLDNTDCEYSTKEICEKYRDKVFLVDFNYKPILGNHYDTIQRITLHIGVNAFRNKCKKIALIDADEFIYLPTVNMKIETFLLNYDKKTIQIYSNILTNKNNDDLINNNILDLAIYLANSDSNKLINKLILDTSLIKDNEFFSSPHEHPTQIKIDKSLIVFYHCYINRRYQYQNNMSKIELLKNNS